MAAAIARLILTPRRTRRHIAVGAASAIPAAACWLVKALGHDLCFHCCTGRLAIRLPPGRGNCLT